MDRISNFADRLREYRAAHFLTLNELAEKTGIPAQTLNRYELSQRVPKIDVAVEIAGKLKINPLWLQGFNTPIDSAAPSYSEIGAFPYHPTHRIPILGRISAGMPLYAEQNIEGYMMTELNGGAEYFALRVKGDSMTAARIYDGDILVVRRQEEVENGQVAIVLVNGEDATVKKFYRTDTTISLVPQSLNPEHQMQVYDLKKTPIKVLGLVVQNVINI